MPRHPRLVRIHRAASIAGLGLIALFWSSSLIAELSGSQAAITVVKTAIVIAIPLLALSLATATGTGRALAQDLRGPVIQAKQVRAALAAANGVLVLAPCAILLAIWAHADAFTPRFHLVQGAELVAGAVNLMLLIANARAGQRLKRRA